MLALKPNKFLFVWEFYIKPVKQPFKSLPTTSLHAPLIIVHSLCKLKIIYKLRRIALTSVNYIYGAIDHFHSPVVIIIIIIVIFIPPSIPSVMKWCKKKEENCWRKVDFCSPFLPHKPSQFTLKTELLSHLSRYKWN